MKHYLALDIGTTNWKAAVFSQDGRLEGIQRCQTKTHTTEDGHSYYDPEELWESYKKLISDVVNQTTNDISAISVASVGEAVVPVDKDGKPLDNIVTWYDTRAFREADELKEKFGSESFYSITGLDINPIFSLPKIMYVTRHNPEVEKRTFKWLQIADFMLMKLSGEFTSEYTLASRTLAFDITENNWSQKILSETGFSTDIFPEVRQSGTTIGTVLPSLSSELGFAKPPKVVLGGHDHPCGTVVTGAVKGNKVHDSSGTAEAYIMISDRNDVPDLKFQGQRTCRWLEKDRYITIGGIVSSGVSFDWAYNLYADPSEKKSYETVLGKIKDIRAIEDGLIFYPNLRGAGAPWWDATQRGSYIGLRDYMDGKHFLKATVEGLCMQSRILLDMHEKIQGKSVKRIVVVGGSSKNILWQQLKADITQREVELCFESEATALGAAMLAAIGDGTYKNIEQVADVLTNGNKILYPDENSAGKYDRLFDIYKQGYEALESVNRKIYEVTGK